MFRLYTQWDAERELCPEDFQYILTPRDALAEAVLYYDLNYRNYDFFNPQSVPRRFISKAERRYQRADVTVYDPVYDALELNLEEGWFIGLDSDALWDSTKNPFYINDEGELIFDDDDSYCWIISEFTNLYKKVLNKHAGRKPDATVKIHPHGEPVQHAQAGKVLNSKGVGRLLAAGGVYNGNVEGFRQTAEQLGGDAPIGYDQVLNEATKGVAIAVVSVASGLGIGRQDAVSGVEQLAKLANAEKVVPVVTAELKVGNQVFLDTNQRARDPHLANISKPTLISKEITSKYEEALEKGKPKLFPNGNMADAHAEVGAIQQAYEAGVAKGADMQIKVVGKDVCGYCKKDIPAMANAAEVRTITIDATDEYGKQRFYSWEFGMGSLKKVK